MPSNTLIIGVFLGVSVFLMVVFFIYYKIRNKKECRFIEKNKNRAVVRLYGDRIKINGRKLKEYDHSKGENLEALVALEPGRYIISGKYKTADVGVTGNRTYETPKAIDLEVELERGKVYVVGIYCESPGEMEADGELEAIAVVTLKASGLLTKNKELYVTCFQVGGREKGPALTGEWLKKVAVSGLYGMQQNASMDTLTTGLGKARRNTILEDWWGIRHGDDAIETLERLVFYMKTTVQLFLGQSPELVSRVLVNEKLLNEDITTMEELQENPVWKRYVKTLKKEKVISAESEVLNCTPLAWDMGRLVFIARLCFESGLISEQKTWEYIDAAYDNLCHFGNWHDFAKSYMIGRTMWDPEHPFISDFKTFEKELLRSGNLWDRVPI